VTGASPNETRINAVGINLAGNGGHVVDGVYVYSTGQWGVVGDAASAASCVINSTFRDCGSFDHGSILLYGDGSIAQGNEVHDTVSKGIAIGGSGSSAVGNVIRNGSAATAEGVYVVTGARNVTISGNTIANVNGNGVKATVDTVGCTIVGNVIDYSGPAYPILTAGATNVSIANNIIKNTVARPSINISYDPAGDVPTDISVTGNVITCMQTADTPGAEISTVQDNTGIRVITLHSVVTNGRVSIAGNTIKGHYLGVAVYRHQSASVSGNVIDSQAGVYFYEYANGTVAHNFIRTQRDSVVCFGNNEANITGNKCEAGLGGGPTLAIRAAGDAGNRNIAVTGNTVSFSNSNAANVGIFLVGAMTNVNVIGNIVEYTGGSQYTYAIGATGTNGVVANNVCRAGSAATVTTFGATNILEINNVSF